MRNQSSGAGWSSLSFTYRESKHLELHGGGGQLTPTPLYSKWSAGRLRWLHQAPQVPLSFWKKVLGSSGRLTSSEVVQSPRLASERGLDGGDGLQHLRIVEYGSMRCHPPFSENRTSHACDSSYFWYGVLGGPHLYVYSMSRMELY